MKTSVLPFEVPPGNMGGAGFRLGTAGSQQLQARRGDDVLAPLLAPPLRLRFVKIDVEGFEPQVVRGLATTLRAHGPVVAFESHGHQGEATKNELKQLGYAHFYVTERSSALPAPLRSVTLRAIERLIRPRPLRLRRIHEIGDGFEPLILAACEPLI